jgi:hypothetical protein
MTVREAGPTMTALRRKRLAGRIGVLLLLASVPLSFADEWRIPEVLPPTAVSLIAWAALALVFWASVCPVCAGAVTLDGGGCVSCRDPLRLGTTASGRSWRHLPTIARVMVWLFGTIISVVALFSFAGAD